MSIGSIGSTGAPPAVGEGQSSNKSGGSGGGSSKSGLGSDSISYSGGAAKSAGSGDETYNVTNKTGKTQSFTYSDNSGTPNQTITLKNGETGQFHEPSSAIGDRIQESSASGKTNGNEALFENGATGNGSNTQNPDVSDVAGHAGYDGKPVNISVKLPDGRSAGNGQQIPAYSYATQDQEKGSGNPMQLANSNEKSMDVTFS